MPPRPKTAERSIEKMLTSWAETPKSPRTITHYREHCLLVVAALREGERNTVELNSKNNAGLQECNRVFEDPPATCEKFDTHTPAHARTRTFRPMNR